MSMDGWILENWFTMLSALGVIGGLFFTAFSLRSETKTRRIANLLTITANHREVWKEFSRNPRLQRVLNASINTMEHPVTPQEQVFVSLVLLHTSSVYYAMKDELVVKLEGLRRDVSQFLSLPIPRAIWEKSKLLQNEDFVAFVESCLNWK